MKLAVYALLFTSLTLSILSTRASSECANLSHLVDLALELGPKGGLNFVASLDDMDERDLSTLVDHSQRSLSLFSQSLQL